MLEIPVTIQGSKTVEGAEQRELFTETTKTTLVFENGAVLKLNAKVSPGQCVFLRNDQTEREILCRVRESRQASEAGYTDLEFTVYDPQFWSAEKLEPSGNTPTDLGTLEAAAKSPIAAPITESIAPIGAEVPVHIEQPTASAQKLAIQKEIKEALQSPAGTPSMESGVPVSAEIPATFAESAATSESPATAPGSPLPVILEAAHESLTVARKHEPTDEELDWNDAKDAELVAALAAMEGQPKAKREPATKETKDAKDSALEAGTGDAKKASEKRPDAASQAKVSTPAPKTGGLGKFTRGKNSIAVGIAAGVLIAAALGFAWHAKNEFSIRSRNRQLAASAQPKRAAPPAPIQPAQTPSSASSTGANTPGVTLAQAAQRIQQPAETQKPGAVVEESPGATSADAGAAGSRKDIEDSAATTAPQIEANKSLANADQEEAGQAKPRKESETNTGKTIPVRIVSQEPPSIPSWATGLEADEVVKLDALIDEKGNLVEAKPISGPRELQHEAERAVALWVFEPALTDGKPTATRMVLTVQFQK